MILLPSFVTESLQVSFPLLIRDSPHEGTWEYLWQTQVFSLMAVPERWQEAIGLLIQVAGLLDKGEEALACLVRCGILGEVGTLDQDQLLMMSLSQL